VDKLLKGAKARRAPVKSPNKKRSPLVADFINTIDPKATCGVQNSLLRLAL
jgi:hypothetical protein